MDHPEMVCEITSKEERGAHQSAHHAGNMNPFPVTENRQPTGRNQAGTDCVQGRIDWRQIEDVHELQTIRGTYSVRIHAFPGKSKCVRRGRGAFRFEGLSSVGLSFSSTSWGRYAHEAELKLSPTDDEPIPGDWFHQD